MIQISKEEFEWLVNNNYLCKKGGKYIDLVITCKKKKASRKKRYVTEVIAEKLKLRNK